MTDQFGEISIHKEIELREQLDALIKLANEYNSEVVCLQHQRDALVAALRHLLDCVLALQGTPIEYGIGMELATAIAQARAVLAAADKG